MKLAPQDSPSAYSIRAVERVCDLLDLAQRSTEGFSLVDVVEATGVPKSSAFRYLATLEARRYLQRDPATGLFHVGASLLPLQGRHLDVLAGRAQPLLEELRDRYEETINLGVLDGNRILYIEIVESQRSMRLAARKGERDHLHSTAVGKAIATLLPPDHVRTILEHAGMPPKTAVTITDIDTYLQEVGAARVRGFALDNGENEEDGRCVAVPLVGAWPPTALSLSAPASRFPMDDVDKVARSLRAAAERLTGGFGDGGDGATGSRRMSKEGT